MHHLEGKIFGRLVVIGQSSKKFRSSRGWYCQCECGNLVCTASYYLTSGSKLSCGCLQREATIKASLKHGDATKKRKARLYTVWSSMKHRCFNANSAAYENYGGRGISICSEWLEYENFKSWAMSSGYKEILTIDRVDNYSDYSPQNCRWVTSEENCQNTRRTVFSPEVVRSIRDMVRQGRGYEEIAKSIGTSRQQIWRIAKRRTWKNVA